MQNPWPSVSVNLPFNLRSHCCLILLLAGHPTHLLISRHLALLSALLLSIRRSRCRFLSLALLFLCTLTLNALALPLILAGLLSRLDKGLVLLISLGLDVCMDEKYLSVT